MFSATEYLLGWSVYLVASVGLLVVWWFLTRRIPFFLLRQSVRVAGAAALLMPYPVDPQDSHLAPAIMMTFLEGLFVADGTFSRVGIPLLMGILLTLIVYLLLEQLWRLIQAKWAQHRASSVDDDPDELEDDPDDREEEAVHST